MKGGKRKRWGKKAVWRKDRGRRRKGNLENRLGQQSLL